VRVRLIRITGVDLNLFEFDYDLTWMAFFLSPEEEVYGRYGGRDASGPDGRLSLAGLRHALTAALEAHRRGGRAKPPPRGPALLAEDLPPAKRFARNECIHCHQVNEMRREVRKASGEWRPEERWVYPLPENVGLTLELDRGDRVRSVKPDSAAARAGVRPGDVLKQLNGFPVASFADVQHALHRAPAKGRVAIAWRRDGKEVAGTLELATGWRWTNLTWRPSLLDILPSLTVFGIDLTPREKKGLGLSPKRLAFRQDAPVHRDAKAAGIREGDVIVGIDGREMEMTVTDFLAYVRRNHLVGDRITLNVLRGGKRIDLPLTLR
jgi:membrane-associated protease RseP (regulator of RpoE activity)